jgi:hypothetical protein
VQDGIDQGETFSPLLWRIYYDPLIHHIDTTYKGYCLNTHTHHTTLSIHTSVVAYMDDTIWIAKNKQELQDILKTVNSFLSYANIKVNPSKSTLITNNSDPEAKIIFQEKVIYNIKPKAIFRHLGT